MIAYILLGILMLFVILILQSVIVNYLAGRRWQKKPLPPGERVDLGGFGLYLLIKGQESPTLIIENALGASSFEWWPIQSSLARVTRVVSYDRAGYGWSEKGPLPRTGENIARELHALLERKSIPGPYLFLSYSQGAIYSLHFAKLFPQEVEGMLFLDPMPLERERLLELNAPHWRKLFWNKSPMIRRGRLFALLGFARSTLKKSPQFEAYQDLPLDVQVLLVEGHSLVKAYDTALVESDEEVVRENLRALQDLKKLHFPLKIIYHSSSRMIREMVRWGVPEGEARQVERMREELTRNYLKLSEHNSWIVAQNSAQDIHLEEPLLVIEEAVNLIDEVRARRARQ